MSPSDAPEDIEPAPSAHPDPVAEGVSRRSFVKGAAAGAGLATVATFWFEGFGEPARRKRIDPTQPGAPLKNLTELEYRTLGAAQDRLLPSGGVGDPGARDVNAIGYLDAVFASGEVPPETIEVVKWGARVLDERARDRFGASEYAKLDPAQRDLPIEAFVKYGRSEPRGLTWLRKMLSYTLEAFFGDPVHGGNPNEIAWKWANHRPGTPRPTEPNWRLEGR